MWVIEEIKRGEIEILFKSYHSDPRPIYALYTEKDKLPLKVQVYQLPNRLFRTRGGGLSGLSLSGAQIAVRQRAQQHQRQHAEAP